MNIQRVFSPGEKPWKRWKCLSLLCPHPQLPTKRSDPDIYGKVKNQIWGSGARGLGLPLFRAELGWGWVLRQVHTVRRRTVLTPSVQIREKRQHHAVGNLGAGTVQHKAWGPLNSTQLEVTRPLQRHHWHTVAWDGEWTSGLGWTPWALCRDQPVIRPPSIVPPHNSFCCWEARDAPGNFAERARGWISLLPSHPFPEPAYRRRPHILSHDALYFFSQCAYTTGISLCRHPFACSIFYVSIDCKSQGGEGVSVSCTPVSRTWHTALHVVGAQEMFTEWSHRSLQ